MKKYYITGVSGTGKSTLTEEFKKRGLSAIDLDDGFCAWKSNETNKEVSEADKSKPDFYDENDWFCDLEKLQNFLNQPSETIFVFGACANQDNFLSEFDEVFLLSCSPEVFSARIDSRTNNNYGKLPSEKENEMRWFQEFNKYVIEKGAVVIDAENSVAQIVAEILANVKLGE